MFCGGPKVLIGGPKLIWREGKNTNLAGTRTGVPQKLICQECRIGAPTKSNLVGMKNWRPDWRPNMELRTERRRDGERHKLMSVGLGVPPKGLEAMCLLLEEQMVQCWEERDDLMLGQRVGLMLGKRG